MENEDTMLNDNKPKETVEHSGSDSSEVTEEKVNLKTKKTKPANFKFIKNPTEQVCLYVTSCEKDAPVKLDTKMLKDSFPSINANAVIETEYGIIVNTVHDNFAHKILKSNLGKIFGRPVQVVPLISETYKKILSFKDVPWCIRNEEFETCLKKQGVQFTKLTREKSTLYVEVSSFPNYQRLREEGINFYNSTVFKPIEEPSLNDEVHYNGDNIIQCYRCQGFWHTASTCKQAVRCVRCGEEHQVEQCTRPKNNPFCCNCKGAHHAAYKMCPTRLKLKKAVRVQFSFNQ